MAAPTGYSFPIVDLAEIVSVIKDWGLSDVLQSQVATCDPGTIQTIYAAALHRVSGITLDSLDYTAGKLAAEVDEYGDICSGGIELNLLLYHMQRMCSSARLDRFTLRDLVQPEKTRTMNILSAVVNFVKFTEEQVDFVSNLQLQSNRAAEERNQMDSDIANLKRRVDAIKSQRLAEQPECGDLQIKIAQMTADLTATKEVQNRMHSDLERLKRERASVLDGKARIRNEISLAAEKLERTRARIVQDPERLKRILQHKATLVQEERVTIATNETKARDLQAKLDTLGVFEQDLRLIIQHLQTTESEQGHLDAADRKLQSIWTMSEQKSIERSELMGTRERCRRQLENAKEKLERAQRNAEERRLASTSTMTRLQKEYEELSVERRDNDKQVEETKRHGEEVEKQMADHLKRNEAEMNELLTQYFRLRHQIELYMETLSNKLGLDLDITNIP